MDYKKVLKYAGLVAVTGLCLGIGENVEGKVRERYTEGQRGEPRIERRVEEVGAGRSERREAPERRYAREGIEGRVRERAGAGRGAGVRGEEGVRRGVGARRYAGRLRGRLENFGEDLDGLKKYNQGNEKYQKEIDSLIKRYDALEKSIQYGVRRRAMGMRGVIRMKRGGYMHLMRRPGMRGTGPVMRQMMRRPGMRGTGPVMRQMMRRPGMRRGMGTMFQTRQRLEAGQRPLVREKPEAKQERETRQEKFREQIRQRVQKDYRRRQLIIELQEKRRAETQKKEAEEKKEE